MERVVLDGVEYTKASLVAKEFKYTSDYIGQLCRAKKIDARLVGRSWFVNTDSLISHKKNKYSNTNRKDTDTEMQSEASVTIKPTTDDSEEGITYIPKGNKKVKVSPVLKNKTMKSLYESSLALNEDSSDGAKSLRVHYERDNEVLYPEVKKIETPEPTSIDVNPAEAKKLRISSKKTNIGFEPTELPEVSLSGKLSILGLEEAEEEEVGKENKGGNKPKNKVISDTKKTKRSIKVKVKRSGRAKSAVKVVDRDKARIRQLFNEKEVDSTQKTDVKATKTVKIAENQQKAAINSTKKTNEVPFTNYVPQRAQPVKISTAVLVSPLIATVLAFIVVTVLFSASQIVSVSDSIYESKVVLQMANILDILHQK